MRDDAKKKETVKMRSSGEHYQVIYHLVKSAMIDRTVGHDGLLFMIYRLDWSFNRITFNSKKYYKER